jgi:hypothetical protein
MKEPEYAEEE